MQTLKSPSLKRILEIRDKLVTETLEGLSQDQRGHQTMDADHHRAIKDRVLLEIGTLVVGREWLQIFEIHQDAGTTTALADRHRQEGFEAVTSIAI